MPEETGTLDKAITVSEDNIKRHQRLASVVIGSGTMIVLGIVLFAYYYAIISGGLIDKKAIDLKFSVADARKDYINERSRTERDWQLRESRVRIENLRREFDNPDRPNNLDKKEQETELSKEEKKYKSRNDELIKQLDAANEKLKTAEDELVQYTPTPLISQELMFGVVSLAVLVISVFTALYRFHMKEVAKNEHYKLGFHRIRIAANNDENKGFGDEVRSSLTVDAFSISSEGLFDRKGKKIDSPMPGHPTSDIATGMVNKLLEKFEIVLQPKK